MKKLKFYIICIFAGAFHINVAAQFPEPSKSDHQKPVLFSDLGDSIRVDIFALQGLLQLHPGQSVQAHLGHSFSIHGIVISKSDANDLNVQTVVIKSSNRKGATLTFTRSRRDDGSFLYLGRIFSYNHSDAFEIVLDKSQYFLIKKKSLDLINE